MLACPFPPELIPEDENKASHVTLQAGRPSPYDRRKFYAKLRDEYIAKASGHAFAYPVRPERREDQSSKLTSPRQAHATEDHDFS
jgi:hypothetical protein